MAERVLESALFGVPVVAADAATADEVNRAIAALDGRPTALLVLRIPATAIDVAQAAERAGAHLCDILLTCSRAVEAGGLPMRAADTGGSRVRAGVPTDAAALRDVGRGAFTGFVGHWHADPRLPTHLADELYARWAADLAARVNPRAPVWVAESHGVVIGFIALREVGPAHWDVPLTAVADAARGRGLLRRMLAHAAAEVCAETPARIDYETQLANGAALRVIGGFGFAPTSARLTFHYWADTEMAKRRS